MLIIEECQSMNGGLMRNGLVLEYSLNSQFWTYLLPAHAWLARNYNLYLYLHSHASLSALYPHIFLILEEDHKETELTDCKNTLETHR